MTTLEHSKFKIPHIHIYLPIIFSCFTIWGLRTSQNDTVSNQKSLCRQHWKIYDSCEGNVMRVKLNKKKHCLFSLLINICCSHLYYYVESSTERADAPGLGLEPKSLNSAYTKHKKFLSKLRLWVVSTFYHGIIRLCITWTSNFCKS